MDFVKPFKTEPDDEEFEAEFDPSEDVVLARGLAVEDQNTTILKDNNGNMSFNDANNSDVLLEEIRINPIAFSVALGG